MRRSHSQPRTITGGTWCQSASSKRGGGLGHPCQQHQQGRSQQQENHQQMRQTRADDGQPPSPYRLLLNLQSYCTAAKVRSPTARFVSPRGHHRVMSCRRHVCHTPPTGAPTCLVLSSFGFYTGPIRTWGELSNAFMAKPETPELETPAGGWTEQRQVIFLGSMDYIHPIYTRTPAVVLAHRGCLRELCSSISERPPRTPRTWSGSCCRTVMPCHAMANHAKPSRTVP